MAATQRSARRTVVLRLANTRTVPVPVLLEPWGEQHEMAPGVTFELVADGPEQDCLEVSLDEVGLTIWGWPGGVVQLFQDGVAQGGAAGRVPAPETPAPAPPLPAKHG